MRYSELTALVILATAAPALADVYRSVDAQGHVQYSDTPSPGAQLVRVQNLHPGELGAEGSRAAAGNAAPPGASTPADTALAQTAARQAVQKDVTQVRAEQCKKAQEQYQQAIEARRLYRAGKNGEREYLSDADSEQARLNARLEVQSACGSAPPAP